MESGQLCSLPLSVWVIFKDGLAHAEGQRLSGVAKTQKSVEGSFDKGCTIFSFRSELPPGKRECCVGQYVVDLTSFEQLVLPVLRNVSACFWFLSPSVLRALWELLAFALTERPVLHLQLKSLQLIEP